MATNPTHSEASSMAGEATPMGRRWQARRPTGGDLVATYARRRGTCEEDGRNNVTWTACFGHAAGFTWVRAGDDHARRVPEDRVLSVLPVLTESVRNETDVPVVARDALADAFVRKLQLSCTSLRLTFGRQIQFANK